MGRKISQPVCVWVVCLCGRERKREREKERKREREKERKRERETERQRERKIKRGDPAVRVINSKLIC